MFFAELYVRTLKILSGPARKILNVFQQIHLWFFWTCGLASGRASFASSRTAMSDRLQQDAEKVVLSHPPDPGDEASLFSHRSEAQRTEAYASPLRSLRPCGTTFLSILRGLFSAEPPLGPSKFSRAP
jgi:hypothetical protein